MPSASRSFGTAMPQQVTARLPDPMVEALDTAARQLRRSRADVIRLAVEHYLEDFDDLSVAIDRLRDPGDPVLDWDKVRRELLRYGLRRARPGSRGGSASATIACCTKSATTNSSFWSSASPTGARLFAGRRGEGRATGDGIWFSTPRCWLPRAFPRTETKETTRRPYRWPFRRGNSETSDRIGRIRADVPIRSTTGASQG